MLRPFFTFYGGKWRCAPHYPPPRYHTLIEPFAGSAGYALRYPDRRVILVERDEKIAGTWRYLLGARQEERLALPDVPLDGTVDDLCVPQEAKWLIGWWLTRGAQGPNRSFSAWGRCGKFPLQFWGPAVRERLARQIIVIRHWIVVEGDYTDAPAEAATWFIDPPYQKVGRHYRFGSADLDYDALADWCRSRRGQVIVCENTGADWLPFKHWRTIKSNESLHGGKQSHEAIWTNESEAVSEDF